MIDKDAGRFVWYELMTTDPKGAVAFYGETVGWKTQPFGEGGDYQMWVGSQGPLGGVMVLPEEAKKMGAPPHWMANVCVTDVRATVAKVRELGGKVYVEPKEVPTVGTFSIIGDPQGGVISAFQPAQPMAPHDTKRSGEFCWAELMTSDRAAALSFYQTIFGWQHLADHDMGPMGVYTLFGHDGHQTGGMMTVPPGMQMPTAWGYYVQVDDLDAAVIRAKNNGAALINGPMEVPGGARIAQFKDPQGAFFAMHEEPKKAS